MTKILDNSLITCDKFLDEQNVSFVDARLALKNGHQVIVLDQVVEHLDRRDLVVPLATSLVYEVLPKMRVRPMPEIMTQT